MAEVDAALQKIATGAVAGACEGPTLDFKAYQTENDAAYRSLADAAICFANAAGGTIVVGVADKGRGTDAFVGTTLDPDKIKQRIYELSRPGLTVEAERHPHHNGLIAVYVARSPDIHSDPQGRALRRVNDACLPMLPDEQARLREERRGVDWSAQDSERQIEEADSRALAAARAILARFPDERRALARVQDSDLLAALGVLTDRRTLSHAGDLLFGSEAGRTETIYQYRSTPGGEPQAVHRLARPLVLTFQRIMDLVDLRQTLTPVSLPNGQQITIENFPALAIREAVSNAICHRDYHLATPIVIEHAPEVIVVTSPGPLVSGVTPSNILTTTSRPRNPALAKAARILGFAEELGRGIDRMYREMIRSGRKVPEIVAGFDQVKVTFVGGAANTHVARFVASLPEQERDDTDTMLLLFRLCSTRTITAAGAVDLLQKTPEECEAVLKRLSADAAGLLERTRATVGRSSPTYRLRASALRGLGSAVLYQRRTTDDIDRKVIAHVREYGRITNRTLQNMFDIDVFKARSLISDLAEREILIRVSTQQRGPKVEWGPGKRFPVEAGRPKKSVRRKGEPLA